MTAPGPDMIRRHILTWDLRTNEIKLANCYRELNWELLGLLWLAGSPGLVCRALQWLQASLQAPLQP